MEVGPRSTAGRIQRLFNKKQLTGIRAGGSKTKNSPTVKKTTNKTQSKAKIQGPENTKAGNMADTLTQAHHGRHNKLQKTKSKTDFKAGYQAPGETYQGWGRQSLWSKG